MENNWRADVPITEKVVWTAVTIAAKRAGIDKRVSPIRCDIVLRLICWRPAQI
jgi:hypothetical protein